MPLEMKIRPSDRKASVLWADSAATNCGRKARKNSATFGLSTLVSAPCQNTRESDVSLPAPAASAIGRERDSSIWTPVNNR